jgi:hypothetical protein
MAILRLLSQQAIWLLSNGAASWEPLSTDLLASSARAAHHLSAAAMRLDDDEPGNLVRQRCCRSYHSIARQLCEPFDFS